MYDDTYTPPVTEGALERRKSLGRLIRLFRGERTQAELGVALGGVPQTTVSRWEIGAVDLSCEQVLDIETALEIPKGTLAVGAGFIEPGSVRAEGPTPLRNAHFDEVEEAVGVLTAAEMLGLGARLHNRWVYEGDGDDSLEWVVEIYAEPSSHSGR